MTGLSSSKVIVREGTSTNAPPPATPTSTTGLVGVTQKGPIGEATLTTSMAEWQATFGYPTAESFDAWSAANGFYAEGGQQLYTSRVVHLDVGGDPDTATKSTIDIDTSASGPTAGFEEGTLPAPWNVTPGTTITVAVDGAAPSGPATFTAAAASATSTINGNGLANGNTINITIGNAGDGYGPLRGVAQPITFSSADFAAIATPTPAEIAAVINSQLVGAGVEPDGLGFVTITDDVKGTGSRVRVSGGVAALFGWPADTTGTGNVANAAAVTEAEFTAIVDAVTTGVPTVDVDTLLPKVTSPTTGGSSSIQLGGTALAAFAFDALLHSGSAGAPVPTLTIEGRWEGTYADDVTVEVSAASSGEAEEFNLVVRVSGERVETFTNLTMDDTATRFVTKVLGAVPGVGSSYVAAIDLVAGLGSALLDRPANGTYALTGGNDGLVGLVDADYVGSASNKKAIYAFDYAPDVRLLIVPGRATSVVHNAALVYCEVVRNMSMTAILDSPVGMTATEVVDYVRNTASLYQSSEAGIIYWPRVKVLNPDPDVFGSEEALVASPSGHIAGLYARNDSARAGGVYIPAGGQIYGRLRTIVGLETREVEDEAKRDLVYPANVNPISTQSGVRALDGVRMLRTNSNFPTIGERRGATFIEVSIARLLEEYRLRNNDAALRAEANRRITRFLEAQYRNGAFRGPTPDTSFYVNTSDSLNTDAVVTSGQFLVEVGIATQKPAEFIVLTVSQDLRAQQIAAA